MDSIMPGYVETEVKVKAVPKNSVERTIVRHVEQLCLHPPQDY